MKLIFLFFTLLTLYSASAFSQNLRDTTKGGTSFNLYPLQLLTGEFRLGFETPLGKRTSVEAGLGLMYFAGGENNWDVDNDGTWTLGISQISYGFTTRAAIRFYSRKKKNHGFYYSPLIFAKYIYYSPGDFLTEKELSGGVQFLVGYKFASKRRFSFDVYGGLGVRHAEAIQSFKPGKATSMYNFPCLPLGITIGYLLRKK